MKMLHVRTTKNSVYELSNNLVEELRARCELTVRIEHAKNLTPAIWREITNLQGKLSTMYLRMRYAKSDARVLIARRDEAVAHLQWIVPASHIGKRYQFVTTGRWAVISCLTAPNCRGMQIYPAMLQVVSKSKVSDKFLIWADIRNKASIRGIEAAGGKYIGAFTQKKMLKGLLSKITYRDAV